MPEHTWKANPRNGYWGIDHYVGTSKAIIGNSLIVTDSATAHAIADALNHAYQLGHQLGHESGYDQGHYDQRVQVPTEV